jgi:hypothetical protein
MAFGGRPAQALQVFAGPAARQHLLERGLKAADVRAVAGAAGGPKALVLNPIDRFVFGHWLPAAARQAPGSVFLVGASIGAWRMAAACLDDPDAALKRLADDYIAQRYDHEPGRRPTPTQVSRMFGDGLISHFGGREAEVLAHPRYRLQVFTSHGRGLLNRPGRWRTPLGYFGAFSTNLISRRAMGAWLERVVFADPREVLPIDFGDYRSRRVPLTAGNLQPAILASCSIPFWLDAVQDIPGAPPGAYWDGGITDYHLHLDYAAMGSGLVLYPHFQGRLVPGWLDKVLPHRHRPTNKLANVVVVAPHPDWVKRLPNAKLPDRSDFKTYAEDADERARVWRKAVDESQALADAFVALVEQPSVDALPLT